MSSATRKPLIFFVCRHNTGRSQMAEAFLRKFAGDAVEVTLAERLPPSGVVAMMAELGIDISAARPKLLDPAVVARADRIITMGCDVESCDVKLGALRIDEDWGLPDPKGQPTQAGARDSRPHIPESTRLRRIAYLKTIRHQCAYKDPCVLCR